MDRYWLVAVTLISLEDWIIYALKGIEKLLKLHHLNLIKTRETVIQRERSSTCFHVCTRVRLLLMLILNRSSNFILTGFKVSLSHQKFIFM